MKTVLTKRIFACGLPLVVVSLVLAPVAQAAAPQVIAPGDDHWAVASVDARGRLAPKRDLISDNQDQELQDAWLDAWLAGKVDTALALNPHL